MPAPATRRFIVHGRREEVRHGRLVSETTFEAAAVAYVEHRPPADGPDVGVIVRDADTGEEHSFVVHLDPAETVAVDDAEPA